MLPPPLLPPPIPTGENNYRYFLSFLFLHIFLFVYATAFFVALLAGEVARRGVLEVPFPGDDGEPVWLKTKKTVRGFRPG